MAGLYRGGALDPFARPKRVETLVALWPDGRTGFRVQTIHDGPSRRISCSDAGCLPYFEGSVWRGAGPDGPWRGGGGGSDAEDLDRLRRLTEGFAANVSAARCEGAVLHGRPARVYRYHSRSETGIAAWSEGDYTVWVDAATGWALQVEEANARRGAAPDPRDFTWVTTIENDPSISIPAPEG